MTVVNLTITRGKTFEYALLYAEGEVVYRPIEGIAERAPLRITVTEHGVPDGWPVRAQSVKAPAELNFKAAQFARVVDADTLEFNAYDATLWKPFAGTGVIAFQKPMDLTGWTARATVRDKIGGTVLMNWDIETDVEASAFVLSMSAEESAALTWTKGVYDAEAVSPDGKVYPLVAISGITVEREVTT